MTETRSINHMKCYLFRMAQEKWKISPSDTAKIFKDNSILEYITECYDYLHLSSYQLALSDIEAILKSRGAKGWEN